MNKLILFFVLCLTQTAFGEMRRPEPKKKPVTVVQVPAPRCIPKPPLRNDVHRPCVQPVPPCAPRFIPNRLQGYYTAPRVVYLTNYGSSYVPPNTTFYTPSLTAYGSYPTESMSLVMEARQRAYQSGQNDIRGLELRLSRLERKVDENNEDVRKMMKEMVELQRGNQFLLQQLVQNQ